MAQPLATATTANTTTTATNSPSNLARGFSRVVLTSDVFISPEKLANTPSMQDGLDADTEYDLRNYGCELIQTAGILLKLPQVAMATGQVLFQRYYYSRSFVRHNIEITAIAAVHLASKIEEAPRRIRDCLNVFHHMKQVKTGRTIAPMVLDQNYVNIKNEVIKAERRCLKELGFCVHVKHPHKIIVTILDQLGEKDNQRLAQFAWNYMNDSFRTDVFMRFSPAVIACSCIFLAARQLQVPLPNSPPWYFVFDANDDQVKEIALTLLRLYARPKVTWEKLESAVADAKRRLRDAQVKERLAKDMSSGLPPSFADEAGNSPHLVSAELAAPLPSAQTASDTIAQTSSTTVPALQQQQVSLSSTAAAMPGETVAKVASPPNAYKSRTRGDDAAADEKRHHAKSSKHRHSRSRHRHRRHSSTSPIGDASSDSLRSRSSSRSVSSRSTAESSHRRVGGGGGNVHLSNGNHRGGGGGDKPMSRKKYSAENGADSAKQPRDTAKYSSSTSKGGVDRGRRSRSRSHGHNRGDSRSRDAHAAKQSSNNSQQQVATRGDSRRSPPPSRARDSGRHHHR